MKAPGFRDVIAMRLFIVALRFIRRHKDLPGWMIIRQGEIYQQYGNYWR